LIPLHSLIAEAAKAIGSDEITFSEKSNLKGASHLLSTGAMLLFAIKSAFCFPIFIFIFLPISVSRFRSFRSASQPGFPLLLVGIHIVLGILYLRLTGQMDAGHGFQALDIGPGGGIMLFNRFSVVL
jgi:hypothetical protein